jgi:hypothetical protein
LWFIDKKKSPSPIFAKYIAMINQSEFLSIFR